MCRILLSINPKYVEKIISGEKKYEFRTKIPKRRVDKIIIYSTSPIMKVLAEVDVKNTISEKPMTIWKIAKDKSGIDKKFFTKYFNNRDIAHAYELGDVRVFDEPMDLSDFGCSYAPQSFVYLD